MRKRERIEQGNKIKESVRAQLIVIYGIMSGIVIISILASMASRLTVSAGVWKGLAATTNALVPTTITLFATALFEYDFVRDNKRVSAVFILLAVSMSLFYAAFVCLDESKNGHWVVQASASLALGVTVVACVYMLRKVDTLTATKGTENRYVSDGCISAIKRM